MPATTFLRSSSTATETPSRIWRDLALILAISFFAFFFNIGRLGFIDPDEPFYALTAREMVQSGDWLTPQIFGEPQFEKPIFYYWLAAGSFALFGESEFTGRLPTSIAGTVLALLTYFIGKGMFSRRVGLIAAAYCASGIEMIVMGRLMLTDIPLTIFVSAALYCYWLALKNPGERDRWMFWHLVMAGFAVLTKGPIGSMATLLCTIPFSIFTRQPVLYKGKGFWQGVAAYSVIVIPWYTYMIAKHGWPFIDEFFIRDNILRFLRAEHPANNTMWYYPAVLILGSIPWLPGALLALRDLFVRVREDQPRLFVKCWFLGNFLFLTAAASKLPSYSYYLFVPIALMIGIAVDRVITHGFQTKGEKWTVLGSSIFQTAIGFAAPSVALAQPFATTVWIFSAAMLAALILVALRKYLLWTAATTVAGLAFVVAALTLQWETIDRIASTRPVARKMEELQKEGEVLMAGKFAVRGIHYYTKQPVTVIANNAQPFWAAHHALDVVHDKRGLEDFLEKKPSALVTMRLPEWHKYWKYYQFAARENAEWFGQNLLIRAYSAKKQEAQAKAEGRKEPTPPKRFDGPPAVPSIFRSNYGGEE